MFTQEAATNFHDQWVILGPRMGYPRTAALNWYPGAHGPP